MEEVAASVPCRRCGRPVFRSDDFCARCGVKVPASERNERAEVIREFAAGALHSADLTARELLRNNKVKRLAGGAALGAGVAMFVPFVTLSAGATLGAAFVGYKMLTKD